MADAELDLNGLLAALNAEDHSVVLAGLGRFRWTVGKQNMGELPGNLAEEYILSSPNCAELLSLWKSLSSGTEMLPAVVDAVATVLLRGGVAGKARQYAVGVARAVSAEHAGALTRMLADEKSFAAVMPALHLLNAIVGLGLSSARFLFQRLDFASADSATCWKALAMRRSKRTFAAAAASSASEESSADGVNIEQDVRTHFMRFCTGLLEVGDAALVQTVLLADALVPALFASVEFDPPVLLRHFFGCLSSRVLRNEDVAPKVRCMLFTTNALVSIAQLFGHAESKQNIGYGFICEVVEFIAGLRTAPFTLGDVVTDPGQLKSRHKALFYLLKQLANTNISSPGFLLTRRLTIKVLESIPEVVLPYVVFQGTFPGMEPRLSLQWIQMTGFTLRILSAVTLPTVPPQETFAPPASGGKALKLASALVEYVGPVHHFLFARALQSKRSEFVVYRSLDVFYAMLSVAERVLGLFSNRPEYGPFSDKLRAMLLKKLPSARTLFLARANVGSKDETALSSHLLSGHLFACAAKYFRVFPELLLLERLNVDKLAAGISLDAPLVQRYALQLIECSRDIPFVASGKTTPFLFGIVCHLATPDHHPIVWKSAARILHVHLARFGLFPGSPDGFLELCAWTTHFSGSETVQFFLDAIANLEHHPDRFLGASSRPSLRFVAASLDLLSVPQSPEIASFLDSALHSLLPFVWGNKEDLAALFETYSAACGQLPLFVSHLRGLLGMETEQDLESLQCTDFYSLLAQHALGDTSLPLDAGFRTVPEPAVPNAIAATAFFLWRAASSGSACDHFFSVLRAALSDEQPTRHTQESCMFCHSLLFRKGLAVAAASPDPSVSSQAVEILEMATMAGCETLLKGLETLVEEVGKLLASGEAPKGTNSTVLFMCFPSLCSVGTLDRICVTATRMASGKKRVAVPLLLACATTLMRKKALHSVLDAQMLEYIVSAVTRARNNDKLAGFLAELVEQEISEDSLVKCSFDLGACAAWDAFLEKCLKDATENCTRTAIALVKLSPRLANAVAGMLQPEIVESIEAALLPVIAEVLERTTSVSDEFMVAMFSVLVGFVQAGKTSHALARIGCSILRKDGLISDASLRESADSLLQAATNAPAIELLEEIVTRLGDKVLEQQFVMGCIFGLTDVLSGPAADASSAEWFSGRISKWRAALPARAMRKQGDEACGALFSFAIACFSKPEPHALVALRDTLFCVFEECKPKRRHKRLSVLHKLLVSSIDLLPPRTSPWQEVAQVLEVFYTLEPKLCQEESGTAVLPALARAYRATTTRQDLALLRVLKKLDENGSPLSQVGFMWGREAWNYAQGSGRSTVDIILSTPPVLLDPKVMSRTLDSFPHSRKVSQEEDAAQAKSDEEAVYDPVYMLPVLLTVSSKLPTGGTRAFAEVGALSYALCSLALLDHTLRSIAYGVLANVHKALEVDKIPERQQLRLLLTVLRNTVTKPNTRLPASVAVFLARAVQALRRPDHELFSLVNQYLLASPKLEVSKLPAFYEAFTSASPNSIVAERRWVLDTLLASISVDNELDLWRSNKVMETIMAEVPNHTVDRFSKASILSIIEKLVERWKWDGKEAGLLQWLCTPFVLSTNPHVVAGIIVKLAEQQASLLDAAGKRDFAASATVLLCNKDLVEHGLRVLTAVGAANVATPPSLLVLLSTGIGAAIAKDNSELVRKYVSAVVSSVSPRQPLPEALKMQLSSALLVLSPDQRQKCSSWIELA